MSDGMTDFETLEDFCAERPPTWSTPERQPQLDIDELKREAHHLLGINNEPGGYMPGAFTTALIHCWQLADTNNQIKLNSQWPELGAAIYVLRTSGGVAGLRRIIEGKAP